MRNNSMLSPNLEEKVEENDKDKILFSIECSPSNTTSSSINISNSLTALNNLKSKSSSKMSLNNYDDDSDDSDESMSDNDGDD